MYMLIILVALAIAIMFIAQGLQRKSKGRILLGGGVALLVLGMVLFMEIRIEDLWFQGLGLRSRYWTELLTRLALFGGGAVIFGSTLYFLLHPLTAGSRGLGKPTRYARLGASIFAGLICGLMLSGSWQDVLRLVYAPSAGVKDPALGLDVGFYLFTLPVLELLQDLLLIIVLTGFGVTFLAGVMGFSGSDTEGLGRDFAQADSPLEVLQLITSRPFGLYAPLLVFALLSLAFLQLLEMPRLLFSSFGVVQGPGWTDMHVFLPGRIILAVLLLFAALVCGTPSLRTKMGNLAKRTMPLRPLRSTVGMLAAILALAWFVLFGALPTLTQWLLVKPNEITYEKPYIANSIAMTRQAFNLDKVEERRFPQTGAFNHQLVANNQKLFDNIRLWDWRALEAVFKQFQEIRLYYQFEDVDVDRYHIDGLYRQVMISAREMNVDNLPAQSATFVNERFKYTHGYGAVLTEVSKFTEQGLPDLLVKDLPPQSAYDSLKIDQPSIYYGELTGSFAVVNSKESELNYPSGEDNVYVHYDGTGGVPMASFWRKFLFGWKYGGTSLFMSDYPREGTRIQFRRQIRERVQRVAPFLDFDADPYVVIADGKLYWIIDAYTSSGYYPYSESFRQSGLSRRVMSMKSATRGGRILRTVGDDNVNYVRNSVKVVVDAYNGDVDMYVFDKEDPIVRAWQRAFPNMLRPRSEMDAALESHIRYPADMLELQGLVYSKYHMTDPSVFYNQEDLWVRATEKYYNNIIPVSPYYVMWEPPESDQMEYVLILPFTPKNRQVLIGWMAGMCDAENYGRLLAYKFPKEKRVLGPQQVETKIDQNSYLSGQLTLWDQRGSNVIRGNVLAIPVEETLVYVEPIYLQAETAAYPELRMVVMMHEDTLSYAATFEEALKGLLGEAPARLPAMTPGEAGTLSMNALIKQAADAFDTAMKSFGEKSFAEAQQALQTLSESLSRLQELAAPDEDNATKTQNGQETQE